MRLTGNTKSGSAILIVVLVMSAVMIVCLNMWRATALTTDLACKRQEREQRFRIAEGVLNYGIALCKERFESLKILAKAGEKTIELDVGKWEVKGQPPYNGRLEVLLKGKTVQLTASIIAEATCAFAVGCNLEQKTIGKGKNAVNYFQVSNWKLRA